MLHLFLRINLFARRLSQHSWRNSSFEKDHVIDGDDFSGEHAHAFPHKVMASLLLWKRRRLLLLRSLRNEAVSTIVVRTWIVAVQHNSRLNHGSSVMVRIRLRTWFLWILKWEKASLTRSVLGINW